MEKVTIEKKVPQVNRYQDRIIKRVSRPNQWDRNSLRKFFLLEKKKANLLLSLFPSDILVKCFWESICVAWRIYRSQEQLSWQRKGQKRRRFREVKPKWRRGGYFPGIIVKEKKIFLPSAFACATRHPGLNPWGRQRDTLLFFVRAIHVLFAFSLSLSLSLSRSLSPSFVF